MRHWTPYEKTQLSRAGLSHLMDKISDETPVEYLIGQVNFCGWNLTVSPAVLIPRVETEDLVAHCFTEALQLIAQKKLITVVEVGTGSGAIGLSLWRNLVQKNLRHRCEVFLSDISVEALAVTEKNLTFLKNELDSENAPQLQQMDLLSEWPSEKPIDLLIANLPYIPTSRIESLDQSVVNYEPLLALDGGGDGLVLIEKLLQQANVVLSKQGVIWLEVDETHTLEKFVAFGLPFQYQTILDCFQKPRFIRVSRAT